MEPVKIEKLSDINRYVPTKVMNLIGAEYADITCPHCNKAMKKSFRDLSRNNNVYCASSACRQQFMVDTSELDALLRQYIN